MHENTQLKKKRMATTIFVVLGLAFALASIRFVREMYQFGPSFVNISIIISCLGAAALNVCGIALTRRERLESAGYLAIYGNPAFLITNTFIKADNSVFLGLTAMVALSVAATSLLPKEKTAGGVLVSFIGGAVIASMNSLFPLPGALVDTVFKSLEKSTSMTHQMRASIVTVDGITEKIGELSSQIAKASEDQALALETIKTGLDQISVVTQTTASCAEESSSAAQMLANTAHNVRQLVSRFTLRSA